MNDQTSPSSEKLTRGLEVISLLIIIACLIVIFRVIPIGVGLARLQSWLAGQGALGIAAYIVIYIVATVLLIPGSALTLLAGVLYGPWWGTMIVSVGATLGAAAAYLLGRWVFRSAL